VNGRVPEAPEFEQALLLPHNKGAPRRVLRIRGSRQIESSGLFEVRLAVLAIAHAGALPAIAKNPVDLIALDDFTRHRRHEFKIVGAQGASDPKLRRSPMAALVSRRIDGDPIGMRIIEVLVGSVWIRACNDVHAQLAAARDEITEGIGIGHPTAAMMERNFRRVISDAASRTKTGGI